MSSSAARLHELGVLSDLDRELGATLSDIAGERSADVALGAAFASAAVQTGHVCVDLRALVGRVFHDEAGEPLGDVALPGLDAWLVALRGSALVASDEQDPEAPRPLVLSGTRLYLARYFDYEVRLARALLERSRRRFDDVDGPLLSARLDALFPASKPGVDGQRRACLVTALGALGVISGGPGTGKTFTVAKLLAILQEQARARGRAPARVLLLAPTGKAAQRLGEAIQQNLADLPPELGGLVPSQASTIHRALGFQERTPTRFRHGEERPLPADVVVVDEASMVDLPLMTKLVAAVHPHARLVLLGDKDQLASVEAGAILAEIYAGNPGDGYSRAMTERACALTGDALPISTARPGPGLHDCMVHLSYVHRFAGGGPIGALAAAVNAGDVDAALSIVESAGGEVELRPLEPSASLGSVLGALVEERFRSLAAGSVSEKLGALARFRFLCAHRRGRLGVDGLNRFVAEHLVRSEVLDARGDWYDGRPILVTANDYALGLFNGDVGVIAEDPERAPDESGRRPLVAFFPGSGSAALRRFAPGQLPPHETVFAMSVHKSQGSELDEVALVLPERASPILTRELLYTGITRAKRRVTLYGSREVFASAVRARVERASGLGDRLWSR